MSSNSMNSVSSREMGSSPLLPLEADPSPRGIDRMICLCSSAGVASAAATGTMASSGSAGWLFSAGFASGGAGDGSRMAFRPASRGGGSVAHASAAEAGRAWRAAPMPMVRQAPMPKHLVRFRRVFPPCLGELWRASTRGIDPPILASWRRIFFCWHASRDAVRAMCIRMGPNTCRFSA